MATATQLAMHAAQLLVDVMGAQLDGQVQPAQALRAAEELVHGHPEIARLVAREAVGEDLSEIEVHRPEEVEAAAQLHGEVGVVAGGQDAEVVIVALVEGLESSAGGVVERLARPDARDARARQAHVGVTAVHGLRSRAVLGREDGDRHEAAGEARGELGQRRRLDAEDEVLDGGDLGRRGEVAQRLAVGAADDVRRGERVQQQAVRRPPRLDRARALGREVLESGDGAVDVR